MRRPLCRKQRWFHAVAMTCLAGFALSGCARGSRDISKNLQENAEREAIEAERHVAERKKQESSSKSDEILKESDFDERSEKITHSKSDAEDPWNRKPVSEESEIADSENTPDADEIRTVSNSELTEELLSQNEPDPARELFDDQADGQKTSAETAQPEDQPEGTVRIRKANESPAVQSKSENTRATARASQPSYRGAQEHPWARKSPSGQVPAASDHLAQKETRVSTEKPLKTREDAESQLLQTTEQVEAKARIEVLVTQARSLMNKGEYRSAYRAAQVAQRIAESNDVYFAAGEEQPADIVRSVLVRIRTQEAQIARSAKAPSRVVTAKRPTPPQKVEAVAGMQIRPKSLSDKQSKPFPSSTSWKEVRESQVAQSSASTSEAASHGVVPATQPFEADQLSLDSGTAKIPGKKLLVPRPFPKPSDADQIEEPAAEPPQLAAGTDWRSESLDNAGSGRLPLLVAPLPPQEPAAETLSDLADDSLAVDAAAEDAPASQSRLWMMLAATAGAFALLFVRRRPATTRATGAKSS